MLLLLGLVAASPCESPGRENPATGKCYKYTEAFHEHCDCAAMCGPGWGLACIASAADQAFLVDWIRAKNLQRSWLFIGNYQDPTTGGEAEGWTNCPNGLQPNYTAWVASQPTVPEPEGFPRDCIILGTDEEYEEGWWDASCISPFHCLCEKDAESAKDYSSWCDANRPVWLYVYRVRAALTFLGGVVSGLPPTLYHLVSFAKGQIPEDWSNRVQARVSAVMQSVGWLILCLGIAPSMAYVLQYHAMPVIGTPQVYASVVTIGIASFVLATPPESVSSVNRTARVVIVYHFLVTVLGILLAYLTRSLYWIAGFSLGCGLTVLGLSEIALLMQTIKIDDARTKLERIWNLLRFSFLIFSALAIFMLVDTYIFWGAFIVGNGLQDEYYDWSAIAFTNICCAIVSTPARRTRFCIWLAALGRSGEERHAAEEASRLVWVDFDVIGKPTPTDA
jgi:hypothetical protein